MPLVTVACGPGREVRLQPRVFLCTWGLLGTGCHMSRGFCSHGRSSQRSAFSFLPSLCSLKVPHPDGRTATRQDRSKGGGARLWYEANGTSCFLQLTRRLRVTEVAGQSWDLPGCAGGSSGRSGAEESAEGTGGLCLQQSCGLHAGCADAGVGPPERSTLPPCTPCRRIAFQKGCRTRGLPEASSRARRQALPCRLASLDSRLLNGTLGLCDIFTVGWTVLHTCLLSTCISFLRRTRAQELVGAEALHWLRLLGQGPASGNIANRR